MKISYLMNYFIKESRLNQRRLFQLIVDGRQNEQLSRGLGVVASGCEQLHESLAFFRREIFSIARDLSRADEEKVAALTFEPVCPRLRERLRTDTRTHVYAL